MANPKSSAPPKAMIHIVIRAFSELLPKKTTASEPSNRIIKARMPRVLVEASRIISPKCSVFRLSSSRSG
jgi:hypothetical protein